MIGNETLTQLYLQGEAHKQLLHLQESIGATATVLYLPKADELKTFWTNGTDKYPALALPDSVNKYATALEKVWEGTEIRSLSFEYAGKHGAVVFVIAKALDDTQEKALKNNRPKVAQALAVGFDYLRIFGGLNVPTAKPTLLIVPAISEQAAENQEIRVEFEKDTRYARLIQQAILRTPVLLERTFSEVGLFYRSCDPIRGDFYWFQNRHDDLYVAVADCTGQGIAGVFMSVLARDVLSTIIDETPLETPADILTELHSRMVRVLTDNASDQQLEDGLDIALCRINRISLVIEYAGANLPLIFWNGKDLLEFRSNKQAIGKNYVTDEVSDVAFSNQEVFAKAGDAIFLMTDGMADQFGEGWSKKLTKKKLLDFIREQRNKDLKTLPARTDLFLSDFRGSTPQTDDYLLIGVRF